MAGWVGRRLGKVDVELLLARGGVAEVYLGRHATLQRAVAVKVLNAQYAEDPDLLDRFQREARAVAMLRHPNIVQVHDFDSVDGHPYLIMEYVPGITLAAHMRALHSSGGRMDIETIGRLLSAIAEGLQYAHGRGVIHRDIKPANILLTSPSAPVASEKPLPSDFQPVLSDFGLVRFVTSAQQTSSGQVAGAPAYMSPEQAAGAPVDARTDVYSLSVVLYELLAGRVPFEADSALTVLQMHLNEAPAKIPDLPAPLQAVLDRGLAKDPASRYGSPAELAGAFEVARSSAMELLGHREERDEAVAGPQVTRRAGNLRTWLWTAAAALVILALAGVVGIRSMIPSRAAPGPASSTEMPQHTEPAAGPVAGDPIGVLRFQDGAAFVDEVSFSASAMPLPEPGGQYEVWLLAESGEERRSVGYLALDAVGNGTTSFVDAEGRNLLSTYNGVEITLEPSPDDSPNPSGRPVFSASLPEEGLLHVRHLLVSFSRAPNAAGLLDGLVEDAQILSETAKAMLTLYESGDEQGTRTQAESILNVLVGSQSPDYLDWDGDGEIEDPGDGYGLLLNGDNSGYIQGSYAHAEFAASSPGATDNMQSHGEHVIISARNLEAWAPQLRDLTKQILDSTFDPAMGGMIRQAVALADNMLLGTDLNGNERIEAITGEGGAQTAYQHALYMADMVVTLPE
jgi:tRNA A-37 threonylcarbamoyl transferase component Bud32